MKIIVLNIEYPPIGGGASPFCKEISELYTKNGHEVEVVTMHHSSLPQTEVINGVFIHRINCGRKSLSISNPVEHLLFIFFAILFIKKMIIHGKGKKFDICHCHFLIPTGLIAFYLKIFHKIPYIITIHGSDVPGYNPDRFKFLHLFTRPIIDVIIKKAVYIVSPSLYLSELLKSKIPPALHEKVHLIRYCFSPSASKLPKENIIMSSGRLLKRKGFYTLIQAVSRKDYGFIVHIFGDGPLMSELQMLAKQSKTKIVLHGWVDNQSALYKSTLAKARIFVLVSSHENSSLSIMEAMDNECAIISSNQTGCFETVNDIGCCVPFDDVEQLELALDTLIDNPARILELGKKAKQKHKNLYNPDQIYMAYNTLLKSGVSESI